jgi:predicted nucleic acid-binding protein
LIYLIDTNVLSQTRKPKPVPEVARWLRRRAVSELRLSAVTVHELRYGVEVADPGARRKSLELWLEQFVLPGLAGQILPVDVEVADYCGKLVARCKKENYRPEFADALIAATAKVHGIPVATLNRKDFEPLGVEIVEF